MSYWLFSFYVYMNGMLKDVKMGIRRIGVRFRDEGREWSLPVLLYRNGGLKVMVGRFV